MSRGARLAGALAAVLALAACTGVPTTSTPEVIGSKQLTSPNQLADGPVATDDPRQVVSKFLDANSGNDANHATARQFLTASESSRWSDERVTVVDSAHVGQASSDGTIVVDGSRLGSIDPDGVYTPVRTGNGSGQGSFRAQFHLTHTRGGWRIDKLPPGLLVDSGQFFDRFQQRTIYFYDAAEQELVPEARYTQFLDPNGLANWMAQTLASGPRDALSAVEVTEFPATPGPSRVAVSVPNDPVKPVVVTVPGALQLDSPTRTKLATQIAATLTPVAGIGLTRTLRIVDASQPVTIPGFGATFTAADFSGDVTPQQPPAQLYYIDKNQGVVNELGTPLPGRIGSGYYDLQTVALATGRGSGGLLIAGTRLSGGVSTLDVGREDGDLDPVPKVAGDLSRPAWSPTRDEVWIGDGSTLYRVTTDRVVTKVPIASASGPAVGKIRAVRFSPEGSRVALVLESPDSDGHLVGHVDIGVVVRDGGKVSVDGLTEISPSETSFNDIAWNDNLKLFGVGRDNVTGKPAIFELLCDGSRFVERGIGVLPDEPDTITIAENQVAAVEAGGQVWKQLAGTWEGPSGVEVDGQSPIYVV